MKSHIVVIEQESAMPAQYFLYISVYVATEMPDRAAVAQR
jgi:hypothetical protein